MKFLTCKNLSFSLFKPKRLTLMAGEKEAMEQQVAPQLAKLTQEDVNDEKFGTIRGEAVATLNAFETTTIAECDKRQAKERGEDDAKLKDPELKKKPGEKAKLEKEIKAKETVRQTELDTLKLALKGAKESALQKIDAAYDELKAKKAKNAAALAEGVSGVLLERKLDKRKENADYAVAELLATSNLDFQPIKLNTYAEGKNGKAIAVAGQEINLSGSEARTTVTEMLKALYMVDPEAARNKVAELRKLAESESVMGGILVNSDVNMDMINKVFNKDGKGRLNSVLEKFYLDPSSFDAKKFPSILGAAAGNLQAAESLFTKEKGTEKYMASYEKAVREALEKGEAVPTVNDWAKKNAPEALVEEKKDPNKLIDEVLATLKAPQMNLGVDVSGVVEAGDKVVNRASAIVKAMNEPMVAYAEAQADFVKRKDAIRSVLQGVLAAEPDATKWDALIKKALTGMTRPEGDAGKDYKLDLNALNTFDYSKMTAGREIYGDAKLPAEAKRVLSGMIMGGDYTYGGKTVDTVVDGKAGTVDYMAGYKKFVEEQLSGKDGKEGALYKKLEKLKQERRDQMDEITETDPAKIAQRKKEIMKANDEAVAKLVREELTPAKFEATLPKPEPKKEEAPKDDDKDKDKDKAKGKEKGKKPAVAGKAADAPKGGSDAAPKKPADAPVGGGKKPEAAPKDQPIAAAGDKKPEAQPGKPPAAPAVQPPAEPETPVEVAVTVPDAVKKQVTQIVKKVADLPRPKDGWKPEHAQAAIDAGVAELPAGLIPTGGKPLRFHSRRMDIEVTVDDKGAYKGSIVAASPKVKEQYGLDVPVITPPVKPDEKVADAKDKPTDKPGA